MKLGKWNLEKQKNHNGDDGDGGDGSVALVVIVQKLSSLNLPYVPESFQEYLD